MISQDALITIESKHRRGHVSEEEINSFSGSRHDSADKIRLRYKESLMEGEQPVSVMVTADLKEDSIRLHRSGGFGADMYFRAGESCPMKYATPFGVMDMIIKTTKLDLAISPELFEAVIEYELHVDGELSSEVSMSISCTPVKIGK